VHPWCLFDILLVQRLDVISIFAILICSIYQKKRNRAVQRRREFIYGNPYKQHHMTIHWRIKDNLPNRYIMWRKISRVLDQLRVK
jgi:hypothetical protein